MKKIFLFSFFFLLISIAPKLLCGQESKIDSLKSVLGSSITDLQRANAYLGLADALLTIRKIEEGLDYSDSALVLSEKIKYKSGIANAYYFGGSLLVLKGNYKEATENLEKGVAINIAIGEKTYLGLCYNSLGVIGYQQGNLDEALALQKRALGLFIETNDKKRQAGTYKHLGVVESKKANYPLALDYLLKCLKISEEIDDESMVGAVSVNIGDLYRIRKEYDEAKPYLLKAIDILTRLNKQAFLSSAYSTLGTIYMSTNNFDEALKYYNLSKQIKLETKDKPGLAGLLNNIGIIYAKTNQDSLAVITYIEVLKVKEELKDNYGKVQALINLANVYENLNRFDDAQKSFEEAIIIGRENNYKELLRVVYNDKSSTDSLQGNYQLGWQDFRQSIIYGDSIFNEETEQSIADLKVEYETEKKEREIIILQKERKINDVTLHLRNEALAKEQLLNEQKTQELLLNTKESELKSLALENQKKENEKTGQQLLLAQKETELKNAQLNQASLKQKFGIAGIIALLLLGTYIYSLFVKRKKLSNRLAVSLSDLKQTQTQLIRLEKEKEAEAIRLRISRDIHDDIGSNLTKIVMLGNLASAEAKAKMPELTEQLDKISEYARNVNNSMGEIIWAVNPTQDTLDNLLAYMRVHTEEFLKETGIGYIIDFPDNVPAIQLNPDLKRGLFLVMKESLNNVVKHSFAKNILFSFSLQNKYFEMQIADDGRGFNAGDTRSHGNGLVNLDARMQQVNCVFKIDSNAVSGSRISVSGTT